MVLINPRKLVPQICVDVVVRWVNVERTMETFEVGFSEKVSDIGLRSASNEEAKWKLCPKKTQSDSSDDLLLTLLTPAFV
jgi:hypothetical protein